MRLGKRLLFASAFIATALGGSSALAQQKGPPPKPAQSSAQFSLHRDEAGGAEGNIARQKARAGDCAGALPAFDSAIRVTIEPTLRRDRGLCHERVGHPFPAIDDYRAYLVARPDAPDADQIRDRLAKLEESVGAGGPSSQQVRDKDNAAGFQASGSMSADGESAAGGASVSTSGKASAGRRGERERGYDYYAAQERLSDAADTSPLRMGTGWILGPYMNLPRYFTAASEADLFMAFGASIRYAWSPSMTFITELGYAGAVDRGASAGGIQTFVGVEGRIPLDEYATNQLFLGVGPGYEGLTAAGADTTHILLGRARFGYRHVFGPSLGLELGVDGGGAYFFASNGGDGLASGLVAGSLALVIGF